MNDSHQPIEELEVFKRFEAVADWTWEVVCQWSRMAQYTVGEQFIRAIDSVGANLSEGDGRGTDRDALKFFLYARGSAKEAQTWLRRAARRRLVPEAEAAEKLELLESALQLLNRLIGYRRKSVVREPLAFYGAEEYL